MIDTHLHLWRLATGWYAWNTPDRGPLHADSEMADVAVAMADSGIGGAVLVQAADTLAETDWLLDLAAAEPAVLGAVGYLPMANPAELERRLGAAAGSGLVGVRQLWHDHDQLDELGRPETLTCLRMLGEAGLAVDVPDAFPQLWPALTTAVNGAPATTFVIDHAGKPPFGDQTAWRRWEAGFTALASRPNVIVKLSGLFGGSGPAVPATAAELARVADLTRMTAGADRIMIGSDWPMIRGRLSYAETISRTRRLVGSWSEHERAAVETGTATAVYRLSRPTR